ncbi:hypothetical protein JCM8547_002495 [Rhodosporidiobolus lusitaniae]
MGYDDASAPHGRGRGRGRGGAGRGRGGSRGGGNGGRAERPAGRTMSKASMGEPGSIPAGSVSKLKAQIRQTTRLLKRDDLTPDVRTTSERRLAALKSELEKTSRENEQSELEKKMATRYRGVKFFERQKLLRKIKQAKKQLDESPDDEKVKAALLEARIDLYYVLRYPKTEKYVALFPDGTYFPHDSPSSSTDASAQKRQTLRAAIRARMEKGELPQEVEGGDLGIEGEEDVGSSGAGKRERSEEVEGGKGKRRKVEEEQKEEAQEEEQVEEAEGSDEQPKKKENRKQRKERKRAEQAAAAAGGAAPPAASTPAKKAMGGKKGVESKEDKAKALVEEDDFFA